MALGLQIALPCLYTVFSLEFADPLRLIALFGKKAASYIHAFIVLSPFSVPLKASNHLWQGLCSDVLGPFRKIHMTGLLD